MTTDILLLLLGLVMVLLGADALVDGASSIARRYGISEFVIGVTIIAFGTSAPEMVVSFISSIEGRADMAVGNIIGSNIFNIAFVLGITALIAPVTVTKSNREWDIPFNVLVSLMLIVAAAYKGISRFDAAVFLAVFITYMWKSAVREKNSRNEEDSPTADAGPVWKAVLFTVGGLAMLIYGGDMFVKRAENIAYSAGLSDKFIVAVDNNRHIIQRDMRKELTLQVSALPLGQFGESVKPRVGLIHDPEEAVGIPCYEFFLRPVMPLAQAAFQCHDPCRTLKSRSIFRHVYEILHELCSLGVPAGQEKRLVVRMVVLAVHCRQPVEALHENSGYVELQESDRAFNHGHPLLPGIALDAEHECVDDLLGIHEVYPPEPAYLLPHLAVVPVVDYCRHPTHHFPALIQSKPVYAFTHFEGSILPRGQGGHVH